MYWTGATFHTCPPQRYTWKVDFSTFFFFTFSSRRSQKIAACVKSTFQLIFHPLPNVWFSGRCYWILRIVFHVCILNVSHKILIVFKVASLNLSVSTKSYSISNVGKCVSTHFHCNLDMLPWVCSWTAWGASWRRVFNHVVFSSIQFLGT